MGEKMVIDILFPNEILLHIDNVISTETRVVIELFSVQPTAACPRCQQESARQHSHYYRFPADLPLVGSPVRLQIRVRRFFCDNDNCQKRTFAEQFLSLLVERARRTSRLTSLLKQIAFEVSAESGARILSWMGAMVSPDSLLRLVRTIPESEVKTPWALGVDDWAKKKGQSYGTILVNLETHQVVDILPDRSAETITKWLQEHPGVEVISRDRGTNYIKGVTDGAPNAIQVADRWHLLKNLREAVEALLADKPVCLKAAANKLETQQTEPATNETAASVDVSGIEAVGAMSENSTPLLTQAEARKQARHARKQERFDLVHKMHEQGFSGREISRQMKMSARTVKQYLQADSCRFYPEGVRRGNSKLDAYQSYLEERWQAGCYNATRLWREICQQGFDGSRGLVANWAAAERKLLPKANKNGKRAPAPRKIIPWSIGRTAWLLVKRDADLDQEEKHALERVKQADHIVTHAYQLVQTFQEMVREQQVEKLIPWLNDVATSGIIALVSFANGIRRDLAAVKNALSLPWSNGQTEGQVNRLKFIKRQMYGRANFDLLRRRVLGYPTGRC
jgi:transposase